MNNTTSDPVKIDLEQLLREGNIIRIKPQGYSMYPLFIPERDEALIQLTDYTDCHRNDVVLYRRDQGILVLHRICRITSDGFLYGGRQPIRSGRSFASGSDYRKTDCRKS